MCDETRVREAAEAELEFMRLMAGLSAAFPATLRTSGSYSVHFAARPADPADLLYWHQRFFEVLDISSLNGHDASVLAEAARTGREVHIYNQGRSRFAFGLYQWRERQAGVRARWEWHLNILHGYQFFDLDGREPDPSMVCYGREGLLPTIDFERCSEGLEDFFLLESLADAVERAKNAGPPTPALAAAADLLAELAASGPPGDRRPSPGHDANALKRRLVAALEALSRP